MIDESSVGPVSEAAVSVASSVISTWSVDLTQLSGRRHLVEGGQQMDKESSKQPGVRLYPVVQGSTGCNPSQLESLSQWLS